jgi:hypothetical protein
MVFPGARDALLLNERSERHRCEERIMAQCHGKGCGNFVNDADAEASSLMIAANIPAWIVKRPERRAPYARRVFGPRCRPCRSKLIKELHA